MTNTTETSIKGPLGFKAGGVKAGLKPSGSLDLAALLSDRPAVSAGVTTTNLFCSAPVRVCRQRLEETPMSRGVIVNAGIANACTGDQGMQDALEMTAEAEKAAGAETGDFLVASTGVIGHDLPMEKLREATPRLFETLAEDGWENFAQAIMTTDTVPKISRRTVKMGGLLGKSAEITILGIAKGSGMIQPNMATMLTFIVTDYPLGPAQARLMLLRATDRTFNCLTIDGDTSTSDTALLLANGAAMARSAVDAAKDEKFEKALNDVCEDLTRQMARDGEGATKLITIEIEGATDNDAARKIAKSVANSNLVKTAMFGNDPNWGRICCAAGYAGVPFKPEATAFKLMGKVVMKGGQPTKFDAPTLSKALKEAEEVTIEIKVGHGRGKARAWTCDFSYDYVKINAEYTT